MPRSLNCFSDDFSARSFFFRKAQKERPRIGLHLWSSRHFSQRLVRHEFWGAGRRIHVHEKYTFTEFSPETFVVQVIVFHHGWKLPLLRKVSPQFPNIKKKNPVLYKINISNCAKYKNLEFHYYLGVNISTNERNPCSWDVVAFL